jgi:hypothetical protein
MKRLLLFATLALLYTTTLLGQTVFLTETFEGGSPAAGWSEAYVTGTQNWRYRNGGYNPNDPNGSLFPPQGPDIARNPPAAHGGTYNAFFQKESIAGERTKLISPLMNLEGAIKPELTFWLAQVMWPFGGNFYQDKLRIYYRNTTNENDWILLQEFTDQVQQWTEFKVNLPNPTATYYIAFEGEIGSGFGVCIDDISVIEKGTQNLWVSEFKVNQPNLTFVPSGLENAQILRLDLKVFGNTGEAIFDNISITSLNTDDNDLAPNGVKLYRTQTQVFNPNNPLGSPTNFNAGVATFSNIGYSLPVGLSYLWVTYDVKLDATHGNFLDAYIAANSILINDTLYPPQNESPLGNRQIFERIYKQDFDQVDHGWILTGDFQIAAPQGLGGVNGRPDPSAAYSGTKVLGNDLTGLGASEGDYEAGISLSAANRATSPALDLFYYKDIVLSFRRHLNVEVWDKSAIDASTNGGLTWQTIWENNNYFIDPAWTFQYISVPQIFERKKDFKFRFRLGPTDALDNYSGWNLDDVILTADFISRDVAVVEWVSPKSGCGHTAAESVVVKVANLGGAAINESFPIAYSFNGGTTWVTNTFSDPLNVGDTVTFTFPTTANLSEPGLRPSVLAKTLLPNDEYPQNDQISTSFYAVPTYSVPYAHDFENDNGHYRPMGTSLWQYGTPNKPQINGSASGTKSWVTHITQTYGNALSSASQTIFNDDFEDELGWTFTGEFERNIPYVDEIPFFANSGFYSIGTDISGTGSKPYLYENGITPATAYRATSPAINVANYRNLKLQFYRYAVVQNGDSVKVEISPNNGNTWYTLWKSGIAIEEDWWYLHELPIHDSLSYSTQLKVRFSLTQSSAAGETAAGWNIDDVKIVGDLFNNSLSSLEFPCFDLVGITKPVIEAKVRYHTEANIDGASLYYSIDNGSTWVHVSNITPYNSYWNWYNGNAVSALGTDGWSGNSGGWITVKHLLPNEVIGLSGVRFRLVFAADKFNNNFDGFAIDDIKVYEAPHDFGISAIVSPVSACDLSATQQFTVTLKNYGIRTIPAGQVVTIGVKADRSGAVQAFTENVTLASPIAVGNTQNISLNTRLNMSTSGFYDVEVFTLSEVNPFFYSPTANDTTFSVVEVRKPFVDLGPDIYTVLPDTISFDVTNPNATSYLWQDASTSPIYNVTNNVTAQYWVQLSNAIPCIARDTIMVYKLNVDLGVSNILSPVSSCELDESTPIIIQITNFGTDTLLVGRPITLGFEFDGGAPVEVIYLLPEILYPDSSFTFEFAQVFDMTEERTYPIRVWVDTQYDVEPLNNELSDVVTVHGYPDFDLTPDYLYLEANDYTLDAGAGYAEYFWHNDGSTLQTFTTDTIGWVVATVTDINGCSTTDSSYIHLKYRDVIPFQVINPITACEYPEAVFPSIRVMNFGTDTLKMGIDQVTVSFQLDAGGWIDEVANLPHDILPNGTFIHTFAESVDIANVGSYSFDFAATSVGEMRTYNDEIEHNISVYGVPDVELGGPYFSREASIDLDAGAGFEEYLWSTEETTQSITVTQSGTYSVTVTNNAICSDTDFTEVTFLRHDYGVSNLINPVTGCAQSNLQSVVARYSNLSNDTLPIGTNITFGYILNANPKVEQNYVTTNKLNPGSNLLFTFTQQVDIRQPDTYFLKVWGINGLDINPANDTINRVITVYSLPVVNLGDDIVNYTGEVFLDAGPGFTTYLWNTGHTGQILTVTQSGSYSVTVTNSNGCEGFDQINVTIILPDYGVTAITSPSSGCELGNSVQVTVTVKNLGTDTPVSGFQIPMVLYLGGFPIATETLTLTSPFAPGVTRSFTFAQTINLTFPDSYTIAARTLVDGDHNPFNDTFTKVVTVWDSPVVNLGEDQYVTSSVTLNAGAGFSSYLWNTGATTQTILASTSGIYSVTVTDGNGCTAFDQVNVYIIPPPSIAVSELVAPNNECYKPLLPVVVKIQNMGSEALPVGLPFTVFYKVGNGAPVSETFELPTALSPSATVNYTFNQQVNLTAGNHTMTFWATTVDAQSADLVQEVTIRPSPNVNLGPAVLQVTFPHTLLAGVGGVTYLWSTGSTSPSITVYNTGTYWLRVTNTVGCSASDTIYLHDGTWTEEIPGTSTVVSVYPNPASQWISVDVETVKPTDITIELIAPNGVRVERIKELSNGMLNQKIDISQFSPGIYLLRVIDGSKYITLKVAIMR